MATASVSGSTAGQLLNNDGTPMSPQVTPEQLQQYVANMGNVMKWMTQQANPTSAGSPANALALQTQGLKQQQAGFATPNAANPLNFLFQGSGYATPGIQGNLASADQPGVLSTENEATGAATNSANVLSTIGTQEDKQIAAYTAAKNAGIGANTVGQYPGSFDIYKIDSRTGLVTNLSTGEVTNGLPPSTPTQNEVDTTINSVKSYANDYYQNNSKPPEMTPATGAGTVQGDWTFDGTQWKLTPGLTLQANAINSYIKDHSKGSPISGLMIKNAADSYGVDPWTLTASLATKSDFGTSGGAQDNQSQSWSAFVNNEAAQLANGSSAKVKAPTNGDPIDTQVYLAGTMQKNYADAKADANSAFAGGGLIFDQRLQKQFPGFNPLTASANTKSISDISGDANILASYRASVNQLSGVALSDIAKSGGLNPSNLNAVNSLMQKIAGQTSNPQYQVLLNDLSDITSSYATILNTGANTESTRAQAQDMVDELAKGSTLQEVLAGLDIQAQKKIAGKLETVNALSSGQNPNPLSSFFNSVTSSIGMTLNGKHYTYNGTGDTSDISNWTQK